MIRYFTRFLLLFLLLSCLPYSAEASVPIAWQAVTATYGMDTGNLETKGGEIGYQILPQKFKWKYLWLYFDGNLAYWHTVYATNKSLVLGSIAPVLRIPFFQNSAFMPYLEISVGAAMMSGTKFGYKDLGAHFTFQDMLGGGISLGAKHQFDISWHYVHYSNASLAQPNDGIDLPIFVTLAYRFS